MTTSIEFETQDINDKTVLKVHAPNIDFRNSVHIKTAIGDLISHGKKNVVLNLTDVNFLDSTGLGVLMYCKKTCESAHGSFSLCGLQSYVQNLVKLTNMDKAITIYANEEAVAGI